MQFIQKEKENYKVKVSSLSSEDTYLLKGKVFFIVGETDEEECIVVNLSTFKIEEIETDKLVQEVQVLHTEAKLNYTIL